VQQQAAGRPPGDSAAEARSALPRWDIRPQPVTLRRRLVRSWRVKLAVLCALAGLAILIVPLLIAGGRFANKLTHPLQDLAVQALPASAHVFDKGVKSNDPNSTGFAFGISSESPSALLAAPTPARWHSGPASDTPDTKFYRSGDLVLTVQAKACHLQRCKPSDSLVYAEVMKVG
jgi:hypothetical protein